MFDSFVTLWTVAWQAPVPMEFSRQEYRSGLPFPSPGDLPDPGIESSSTLTGRSFTAEPPGKPTVKVNCLIKRVKNKDVCAYGMHVYQFGRRCYPKQHRYLIN